jgi:hypothetical protein
MAGHMALGDRKRTQYLQAVPDRERSLPNGVRVVASYQTLPVTRRPFKVRGVVETDKLRRIVEIALSCDEARKLVDDFQSFRPDVFA